MNELNPYFFKHSKLENEKHEMLNKNFSSDTCEVVERRKGTSTKNLQLQSQINSLVSVQFPVSEISSVYLNEPVVLKEKTKIVKCKVIFARMGNINTKLERFDSQIFIESFWEDDSMLYSKNL